MAQLVLSSTLRRSFSPRISKQTATRQNNNNNKLPPSMKVVMLCFDGQAYRASLATDIGARLDRAFPPGMPAEVGRPMRHLVSAATETLAPELCVAACELVGGGREHALDAACALGLMHAGTCAHRRLFLPAHHGCGGGLYSPGVELLTGDGVLTLGYELLGRCSTVEPALALRALVEVADAMGAAEEGEEEEGAEGRMCGSAAACGAILGGAGEEAVERLRRCGRSAGMMHGLLRADGGKQMEAATRFKSLARLELEEGFEEGKRVAFLGLLDWWYEEGSKI